MRILICNWKDLKHPAAGGAEVYTEECARRWVARGHEVTLCCASVDNFPSAEIVEGVQIIRSGGRVGVYGAIAAFVRTFGATFDVIIDEINTRPLFAHHHCTTTPVVAFAHQVAREVWHHEMPWPVALAGRYVLEPKWLKAYADVPTLTVSQSSAESLADYGLRRVEVLPEGVELPVGVGPLPKFETPSLVFCGRLVSMKRPQDVIAAFNSARHALGAEAELHILGSGPLEPNLQRLASPGVIFHGFVSAAEKYTVMARCHALIAASVREGWGLVVSEAAAVGTPSIAYNVPGLRDSVLAAKGVLTEPTVDSLAAALKRHVPRFQANPPPALPHGGAASWDFVAAAMLDAVDRLAFLSLRAAA